MTIKEQVEYHNILESKYPEQAHYTYKNVKEILEISKPQIVLEFGCWKGDMAKRTLNEFNIEKWYGIEICESAIKKTNCNNPKFSYIIPTKFDWFEDKREIDADVILATHFIEHLSNSHFDLLVKYCHGVKYIYFEAPIFDTTNNWLGYLGTHKLEYGWNKIIELMSGYSVLKKTPEGIMFILND